MKPSYYGCFLPPKDNIAIFQIDAEPLSIDPAIVYDYTGGMICHALFEPLFVLDHKTATLINGAAQSCSVSDDGLQYHITIRPDARWSNGLSVTAYDFEYAFQRLVDPATNSSQSSLAFDIVNAEEIRSGKRTDVSSLGVHARNDHVLQIQLHQPVPHFLQILSSPNFSPVPRDVICRYGNDWTRPGTIISNGPFVLKARQAGEYLLVQKNHFYFNSSNKAIAGIKFIISNNIHKQMQEYKCNRIHVTCNTMFDFEYISEFRRCDDFCMDSLSLIHCLFCNLQDDSPFSDPAIRRALYGSINKDAICKHLWDGISPVHGFIPDCMCNSSPSLPLIYQPKNAMRPLQTSASWLRLTSAPIEIIYTSYYPNREILLSICEMWNSKFGIETHLTPVTLEEIPERLATQNFALCYSIIPANYNNPLSYLQGFFDPQAFSKTDYSADDYCSLLLQMLYCRNRNDLELLHMQANERLLHTLPAFPLFQSKSIYLQKPFIQNFSVFPCGQFSFRSLDIKKDV